MFEQYPDLLTVKEAAEALRVSEEIMRKLVKNGTLRAILVSHSIRISKEDLIKFVRGN